MTYGTGPIDWMIRFVVVWLLIFIFSCVLLRPLWKLTMSRPSLIIVFSRAIGNFLQLFSYMPNFIVYNIFNIPIESKSYYLTYDFCEKTYGYILSSIPHVHNLALAVNRSHAMFFPFHYNMVFAKKNNIYVLCLCLWLICICVGGSNLFVYNLTKVSLRNQLNTNCMYASGLVYAALGCRMLWMRYKRSSVSGATTEKDSIKILVVCFACLVMSSLNQLVVLPIVDYANENFPDTPRLAVYWVSYTSRWLVLCTEEICLALLVHDFRRNVKQQLRSVFCCCRGNKIESSNSNMYNNTATGTVVKQPIRVVQITKVNINLLTNRN